MSKTVDSKVVEMQFDNRKFESNVATSMSTLDKLKHSLNFEGAAKGFDNINKAAKGFDISPMGNGIENVKAKFSALEVVAITALANITNSVVNAGKRLIAGFTVVPIKTGWEEYELKMNSVQTIMASTGESLETVNWYLDELNKYSDDTIYSFSDMTQNIGKFTNAGVKLKDAVAAIKGISNEAAVSGANANEASRAMYNFAQALSSGYVKLIDWKSIENANMATVEFKNELIKTALALGTVTQEGDKFVSTTTDANGSVSDAFDATRNFNDSLSHQWMTTEVLTETLKKYADETTEIGKKATQAATEVKTFSMMMDTLKEAVQSGWAQTWEILFGDFNEGKKLWTELSNFFGDLIGKISDARNNLLKDVFKSPFESLTEKLSKISATTEEITEKAKDYGEVVDKIIHGDYGSAVDRWEKLTEEGYDWAKAQNLVNEKLNDGTRYSEMLEEAQASLTDQKTRLSYAQLKELGLTKEEIILYNKLEAKSRNTGKSIQELAEDMDLLDGRAKVLKSFKAVFEYIGDVFGKIREAWSETFEKPDISGKLKSIIDKFYEFSQKLKLTSETGEKIKSTFKGLFTILDIIKKIVGGTLKTVFEVLAKALGESNINILDITSSVGDAIISFRDWLKKNEYLEKSFGILKTALNGAISIIKKITNVVADFIKSIDFDKIKAFGSEIRKSISNLVSGIDFNNFKKIGGNIVDGLVKGIRSGISKLPNTMIEIGRSILDTIKDFLGIHSPSTKMEEVGENTVEGLFNGIQNGISKIVKLVRGLADKIVETVKKINWKTVFAAGISVVLVWFIKKIGDSIASIASVFEGLGSILSGVGNVINVFANQLKDILKGVTKVLNAFAFSIRADAIKNIAISLAILVGAFAILTLLDEEKLWKSVGVLAVIATILGAMVAVIDLVGALSSKLSKSSKKIKGISGLLGSLLDEVSSIASAFSFKLRVDSIASISKAITILVGAVSAMSFIPTEQLKNSVKVFAIISGILAGLVTIAEVLAILSSKFGSNSINFGVILGGLLGISVSILLVSSALNKMGSMKYPEILQAINAFSAIIINIITLITIYALLMEGENAKSIGSIDKVGKMLLKIAASLAIIGVVVKAMGSLKPNELEQGIAFLIAFAEFVALLTMVSTIATEFTGQFGSMMLKIAASMALMALVVKMVGNVDPGELINCATFASGFLIFVIILQKILEASQKGVTNNLATTLLSISGSMLIMALIVKIIQNMKWEAIAKGMAGILGFELLVGILVGILNKAKDAPKLAGMLLAISGAIAIISGIAIILGILPLPWLAKGVAAVAILGIVVSGLIAVTKLAKDAKGDLIAVSICISVLAAASAILGFIPIENLKQGIAAVIILGIIMAVLITVSGLAKEAKSNIVTMTVALGVLSIALGILSMLPTEQLVPTALALGGLMLAIAEAMLTISKTGSISITALASLGVMVLVIGALGVVLYMLGQLQIENMISSAVSLGALILALAGAMALLSGTSGTSIVGAVSMIVMAGALVVLSEALAILDGVPFESLCEKVVVFAAALLILVAASAGIEGFALGAGILAVVLVALSVALISGATAFYVFAKGLEVAGQALPLIGEGLTACGEGLKNFIEQVASTRDSIGDFAAVIVTIGASVVSFLTLVSTGMIIAAAGALILGAGAVALGAGLTAASLGLTLLSSSLALVALAVTALSSSISTGLEMIVSKFTNFTKFGEDSGGNLLEGFKNGIKNKLSSVWDTCKEFANGVISKIKEFLGIHSPSTETEELGRNTDEGFALGIENGAPGIESAVSGLMDNVKSWFGDKSALPEALSENGTDASNAFSLGLGDGVDSESFLAKLTEGNFDTSNFETLLGKNGIEAGGLFSSGLADGVDFSQFESILGGEGNLDLSSFKNILGEGGIDAGGLFSSGLADGVDFNQFNGMLDQNGNLDTSTFKSHVKTDGIEAGGLFSSGLADGVDFSQFESILGGTGVDISNFSSNLGASGKSAGASFSSGLNAGAEKVNLNPAINSTINQINSNRSRFYQAGVGLIEALARGISSSVKKITSSVSQVLKAATNSITSENRAFTQCGSQIIDMLSNGIKSASGNVKNAVTALTSALVAAINSKAETFNQMGSKLMQMLMQGIQSGANRVKKTFASILTECLSVITSKQSDFSKGGSMLATALANGIQNGSTGVMDAISAVTSAASNAILYAYDAFVYGGQYLVEGFAEGVSNNAWRAQEASKTMADVTYQAAKRELEINSPSKKFRDLAGYIPEGFAQGIDKMSGLVKNSAIDMAKVAISSTKNALSKIGDIASGNKSIAPTIRPVVDLDNIRTSNLKIGANIGEYMNKPISSLSNIIATAQNEINSSNNEVISAIKGLRADLQSYYSQDDSEIALYVDSKKLATSLARPMNRQLNILSQRGAQ